MLNTAFTAIHPSIQDYAFPKIITYSSPWTLDLLMPDIQIAKGTIIK